MPDVCQQFTKGQGVFTNPTSKALGSVRPAPFGCARGIKIVPLIKQVQKLCQLLLPSCKPCQFGVWELKATNLTSFAAGKAQLLSGMNLQSSQEENGRQASRAYCSCSVGVPVETWGANMRVGHGAAQTMVCFILGVMLPPLHQPRLPFMRIPASRGGYNGTL